MPVPSGFAHVASSTTTTLSALLTELLSGVVVVPVIVLSPGFCPPDRGSSKGLCTQNNAQQQGQVGLRCCPLLMLQLLLLIP